MSAKSICELPTPVLVIPSHACSTCNLYEQIVVHDGDAILDVWRVSARGYPLVPDVCTAKVGDL